MPEQTPNYNEGERAVLRQARFFKDLVTSEPWKEYVKVLEAHIAIRTQKLFTPLHALPKDSEAAALDFQSKAAAMESVKGALIGLRLARDLPQATIDSASEIIREHSTTPEEKK